jgi:drug/metabolite transporter (DMT)-like permease
VLGTGNISLISGFAREAGVSPSAIVSLTILASFTTACAFYFLYGEILNQKHWMGMFAIMISVIVIGFSRGQKNGVEATETDT